MFVYLFMYTYKRYYKNNLNGKLYYLTNIGYTVLVVDFLYRDLNKVENYLKKKYMDD